MMSPYPCVVTPQHGRRLMGGERAACRGFFKTAAFAEHRKAWRPRRKTARSFADERALKVATRQQRQFVASYHYSLPISGVKKSFAGHSAWRCAGPGSFAEQGQLPIAGTAQGSLYSSPGRFRYVEQCCSLFYRRRFGRYACVLSIQTRVRRSS